MDPDVHGINNHPEKADKEINFLRAPADPCSPGNSLPASPAVHLCSLPAISPNPFSGRDGAAAPGGRSGVGLLGAGRGVGAALERGQGGGAGRIGHEGVSAQLLYGFRMMVAALGLGLLALALGPGGVWAQIRLEEAGGGLRAPGDSVLLSCRGYGFSFGTYSILWYRQAPGGRPEWVSFINPHSTTTESSAAVKGRATVSRDNSRSEAYLSLHALQPQDSARYFCAVYTETGKAAEL
ncbi:uncharacterized protein ACIB01_016500 [Guaruba guarouba]